MPSEEAVAAAAAAAAPAHGDTIAVVHSLPPTVSDDAANATGLHSPPDSNNAVKLDGSDSELSELDDAIADEFKLEAQPDSADGADDIGDVEPDHYSGTVPVFKPTMHQFGDFKKFVRPPALAASPGCWLANWLTD